MSSVRLTQRLPGRPAAENSPSPDKGTKSVIVSTTPPKINKQHLDSKREKDMAIHKIKEENKKLKSEMKILLDKNKDGVAGEEWRGKGDSGTIKKNERREERRQEVEIGERATQKHTSKKEVKSEARFNSAFEPSKPHSPSNIDVGSIKAQLLAMVEEKQSQLKNQVHRLEERVYQVEQSQMGILERMQSLGKSRAWRRDKMSFQSSYHHDDDQFPGNSMNTPKRSEQKSRDAIKELQSQLKGAESTILKLQQMMKSEQNESLQLRIENKKKQQQFRVMKLENESFANDLKIAYKEASESRQLKVYYEKEIEILKERTRELEKNRQEEFFIEKDALRKSDEHQEEIRLLKKEVESVRREDERRRASKVQIDELQSQMEKTNSVLKELEDQIEVEKSEKAGYRKEIEQLKGKVDEYQRQTQEDQQRKALEAKDEQKSRYIAELESKLTDMETKLSLLQQEHETQMEQYSRQITRIKQLTKQIPFPDSPAPAQSHKEDKREIERITLEHKQQILKLQLNVSNVKLQKETAERQSREVEQQNKALKQEIKWLKDSILKYSKGRSQESTHRVQEIEERMVEESHLSERLKGSGRLLGSVVSKLNQLYSTIDSQLLQNSSKE